MKKPLGELERLIAEDRAAGGTDDLANGGGWLLAARKNHFPGAVIGRFRWWTWILLTLRLGVREALDMTGRALRMEAQAWRLLNDPLQRLIDAHESGQITEAQRAELQAMLETSLGIREPAATGTAP